MEYTLNEMKLVKDMPKKYFDEEDSDQRLTTTDDDFRVTIIFYPVIDTTLLQLKFRFQGIKAVCHDFDILLIADIISGSKGDR